MPANRTPSGPPMVAAQDVPTWSGSWSLGLPLPVAYAGDVLEAATAAGAQIPAAIVERVRQAAHVSEWQNEAQTLGNAAEARWRAEAVEAIRNLAAPPRLDDLLAAKAARDVDGLAAGIMRDLARETVASAYRSVRDNAPELVVYGLAPLHERTLEELEELGRRISPLIVDEVTALKAGQETAGAWLEAADAAARYGSLTRSRSALQHVLGVDTRDRHMLTLLGRRVDQRAVNAEPAHPVAAALHRARNRRALELWMPTPSEYAELLDAKAAA